MAEIKEIERKLADGIYISIEKTDEGGLRRKNISGMVCFYN